MATKFFCRNCSKITTKPKSGMCDFFSGSQAVHDWIPFQSDDEVGAQDTVSTFNKKIAFLTAFVFSLLGLATFVFTKVGDPTGMAILFAGIGFFAGGFYKQVIQTILAICLLFGLFWVLDYYKIIDNSPKSSDNPPKVKKVSK
jgi:hypothetical protein